MHALAILALALGQYVSPAPTPAGGPVTYVLQNATVSASGAATLTGISSGEVDLVYAVGGPITGTIQFAIYASDPQNPNGTLTGDAATQTSPTISTAPTRSTLRLAPLSAGASVLVTWTVGGGSPSIQGVNLTVTPAASSSRVAQGSAAAVASAWPVEVTDGTNGPAAVKPASTAAATTDPAEVVALSPNSPMPPANTTSTYTQVCCGTSATAIPTSPLPGRVGATIVNQGSAMVCIGGSGVSAPSSGACANGFPLAASATLSERTGSGLGDYCIAASAQSSPACCVIREVK